MTLKYDRTLTSSGNPELDRQVSRTVFGMAHFAGTGPDGATCGQCEFWNALKPEFMTSAQCIKAIQMTRNRKLPKVPKNTEACRHFTKVPL